MALAPIPWNVSDKTLAEFSEVSLVVFGMIAAPTALWRGSLRWAIAFWCAAVIIRVLGWVRPSWLKPLFLGMILVGWPIGWVIANALLFLVYIGIFTPIGLVLRWRRGDFLGRRFDPAQKSYWAPSAVADSATDYLRQF